MADKLKLSAQASERLNFFSSRLSLKRNVVSRIALSVSLSLEEPVSSILETDTDGYEFNKPTIIGPDETMFRAMVSFVQNESIGEDFFNIYVRNHIERGLEKMYGDYELINSPSEFMSSLIS